jgi:hypothetical protein
LKLPGWFYAALNSAAFSLALVFIPNSVNVVHLIGLVAFLLSVLAAWLAVRESRRNDEDQQRRLIASSSRTGVERTLNNLYRR